MSRRAIEIVVVAAVTVVAFVWTLSAAVALMPIVYYLASRRERRPSRTPA